MPKYVSAVQGSQQAAHVTEAASTAQTTKPASTGAAPSGQDTVTISAAARAAQQSAAAKPQASGDVDHDGDSK